MKSLATLLFLFSIHTYAQVISQFNWNSNPVTAAVVGPNATSVSASASADPGGVGGTNGLNAGTPKADINLVIPGSPTFDVPGIDVSFDYHREESQCDWFTRGNSLIMDGSNQFAVSYRVDNGSGGFTTVNSGNTYNIPNDDVFRNYRFIYLPVTGTGYLLVDGVVVWSNDGPDNRNMYWTGAGNVVVGNACDGNGADDTFMDNLIVGSVTNSGLPIELKNFVATPKISLYVDIEWTTASETNNDYFTLERSSNGTDWDELTVIDGAGNSTQTLHYNYTDENPYKGVSYYRLKQTDFDGAFTYSSIQSVVIESEQPEPYPNPTAGELRIDILGIEPSLVNLMNSSGQKVAFELGSDGNSTLIDLSDLPSGLYFLTIQTSTPRTFRIFKE